MSKKLQELMEEMSSMDFIDNTYSLHVMSLNLGNEGDVLSIAWERPIQKIEFDSINKECLFHFSEMENSSSGIKLPLFYASLDENKYEYVICAAINKEIDDATVRIDYPIIGVGENIDEKKIIVVTKA